jgi:hypothetical protein
MQAGFLVAAVQRAALRPPQRRPSHRMQVREAMMVMQTSPELLRSAVFDAVTEGAWTPADVVASVATDYVADRATIVAVLWDLVEEGLIRYDASLQFAGFRRCC